MTLTIDIIETKDGDIAMRMRREPGMGTNLETAYCDAIVEDLKTRMPIVGKKLGGKGMIGGNPEQQ